MTANGPQTLDPQATDKAWEEIRQLVDEVARLSATAATPHEFYTGLLDRVVAALAGVGGAVWILNEQSVPEIDYQIALDQVGLNLDANKQVHRQLLAAVMQKREAIFVPPHAGMAEDGPKLNPSEFLLLLAPLVVEDQVIGVVEVFKRPTGLPSARKGYVRFLTQMCILAGEFHKNHQLRLLKQRQTVWGEFENFTRVVHGSLSDRQTCYVLANEGRRFIEADRISVAITRGRKSRVESISGQDVLNRRSNTVRLLDKLTSTVVRAGEPFWFTEETKDLPPQIEKAVHDYVDESHSKSLAIIPLYKPTAAKPETGATTAAPRKETIGALVVEQFDRGDFDDGRRQRIMSVCEHASTALDNSLQHSRIFLLPLWTFLGKASWLFSTRTLPKTALALLAVAAIVYGLVFVQYDFALEGKGTLEPQSRADVFAPMDADVKEVLVEHNTKVRKGQPLVLLDSRDLRIRLDEVRGKLSTSVTELVSVRRRRQITPGTAQERQELQELAAKEEELKVSIESLKNQEKLLVSQESDLRVCAPLDGAVVTWNVRSQLMARPVQRGQILLTIAQMDENEVVAVSPDAPEPTPAEAAKTASDAAADKKRAKWQLEVMMPEDRMGHILEARSKLPPGEKQKATFILATDPGKTHEGTIREITMSASMQEEKGNSVKLVVDFNRSDLPTVLRPGAEVTAKVHCGRKAFGYVWFHDVIEFIQSKVLFRL